MKKSKFQKLRKTKSGLLLIFIAGFFLLGLSKANAAAESVLSFEPATKDAVVNDQFDLVAKIDPGNNDVVGVTLNFSFDPSKLELQTITRNSSDFPTEFTNTIDNNTGRAILEIITGFNSGDEVTSITNMATLHFLAKGATTAPTLVEYIYSTSYVGAIDEVGNNALLSVTPASVTITSGNGDTTPPVRLTYSPTQTTFPAGTPSVNLGLTTDENATCKYATSSGVSFDLMPGNFSGSGTTTHTATISVVDGGTYGYFVKCRDSALVPNTSGDYPVVAFSVLPGDNISPTLSLLLPNGELGYTITSATLSVTTSESATCRYSTSNVAYNSMPPANNFTTANGILHTRVISVTGGANGTNYKYYVRCQDTSANKNESITGEIVFSVASAPVVDSDPPVRSLLLPNGTLKAGTTSTNLSLTTNENATCKYGTSDAAYDSLTNQFSTTGGTSHSQTVSVANGASYIYYVRCRDVEENVNSSSSQINFSVAKPSNNDDDDDDDKKSKKKKKSVAPRSISVSKRAVRNGQIIIERGKKFSKDSFVLLYFAKYGNVYHPPIKMKTTKAGSFMVKYKVNKPFKGKYYWYAVDLKTGKKSKTSYFMVK